MGFHRYCACGGGLNAPTVEQLLYGQKCANCFNDEKFSTEEKVDFLLYEFIEKKEKENKDLRDYFAAKALPAIIISSTPTDKSVKSSDMIDAVVSLSYIVADSMMKERAK